MRARGDRTEEGQGGLVALALVLLVIGVGMTIQLSLSLSSGPDNSAATGAAGSPLVAPAADIQAKQTLSSALSAVQAAQSTGGPISDVELDTEQPGVTFGAGPSTGPSMVSVAAAAGPLTPSGTPSQYVTLAIRSDSGTCWYIWLGGAVPWFGARVDQHECTAPPLLGPPGPSGVSATAIGWQSGGYPAP